MTNYIPMVYCYVEGHGYMLEDCTFSKDGSQAWLIHDTPWQRAWMEARASTTGLPYGIWRRPTGDH